MAVELLDGVRLYRWLFVLALGASLGGIGVGAAVVAPALARRRSLAMASAPTLALALLAVAGLASFAWAILSTLEGSPFGRVTFENGEFLRDLRFIAAYAGALVAGVAIALVLGGFSWGVRLPRLPRAARLALVPLPGAALALSVVAIVGAVDEVTSDAGFVHPKDAHRTEPVDSVSLGRAAFATGLVVTPTGELFFAESSTGRIGVLSPTGDGGYRGETFGTIALPTGGRLFHLELHPGWPEQPYIYATAHEGEGEAQRLSVLLLEADGDTMRSVRTLVAELPTEDPRRGGGGDHYGSALAACGGYLYVSVGDTDSDGPGSHRPGFVLGRAQIAGTGEGKVLRYRIAGDRLESAGVLHADPPVYAMGLRNPFDMVCTADDTPILVDNGPIGNDQVRLVAPGSNHEWPFSATRSLIVPPLWDSGLSQLGPTGVGVRPGVAGEEVLVASFHMNAVYRLAADAERVAAEGVEVLHEGPAPLLAMTVGGDGCVFIADVSEIRVLAEPGCATAAAAAATGSAAPAASFEGSAASIYRQSCASCHGTDREGGQGPSLRAATLTGGDEGYIATILGGRAGTVMPGWGALGLTAEQARALLDYLRSD